METFHSITDFDRKHLAPRVKRAGTSVSNEAIIMLLLAAGAFAFFHYLVLPGLLHAVNPELF